MIENYGEIEELLSAGEMEGRRWVFDRGRAEEQTDRTPTDHDILDLHRAMFGHFLEWAGATRLEDRGPGGIVSVPWPDVRVALRNLSNDMVVWVGDLATTDATSIASVIADVHHRFQWIHPFKDTNGRTGRVLDHYLLWVTFGLRADSLETSPVIEYFPSEAHEDEYYDGLQEADLGRPERIRAFYLERLLALFEDT